MLQTISILIRGKVQGVFFRQSTKEKATDLNVTGIVKNLTDGSVYIIASGTADRLNALVEWCRQGPRRAKVIEVKHEFCAYQPFEDFKIER